MALAAIAELGAQGLAVDEAAARRGLAGVCWPARVEVVGRRPSVVLDAAHNVASVEALVAVLDESFAAKERILVFATTRDKDALGMLRVLLPKFDRVILTRYADNPRGMPVAELARLAATLGRSNYEPVADPPAAWQAARQLAGPDSLIAITGSFFIAAEMRRELERHPWAADPG